MQIVRNIYVFEFGMGVLANLKMPIYIDDFRVDRMRLLKRKIELMVE